MKGRESMNHPSDRCIKITARYAGTCAAGCGHRIQVGDSITYDRVEKKAAHVVCPQLQESLDTIAARGGNVARGIKQ
jgi:hypothetical protein